MRIWFCSFYMSHCRFYSYVWKCWRKMWQLTTTKYLNTGSVPQTFSNTQGNERLMQHVVTVTALWVLCHTGPLLWFRVCLGTRQLLSRRGCSALLRRALPLASERPPGFSGKPAPDSETSVHRYEPGMIWNGTNLKVPVSQKIRDLLVEDSLQALFVCGITDCVW